jgi:CRP-like cAMP-binding protein
VVLGRLCRNAIFGEVSFLMAKPHTANVTALDAVEVIRFKRKGLAPILSKYPKIKNLIQVMMSARAEQAIEKTLS